MNNDVPTWMPLCLLNPYGSFAVPNHERVFLWRGPITLCGMRLPGIIKQGSTRRVQGFTGRALWGQAFFKLDHRNVFVLQMCIRSR